MGIVLGVDASRNRSGGGIAHAVGILTGSNPADHGIDKVHLWAFQELADAVPDFPWLEKHSPAVLKKSLPHQVWWQYKHLPAEARALGCDIMFNTDAGSVCPFDPGVTLSQDMLSFEPGEMWRFGLSRGLIRLILLRYIQIYSLSRGDAAMFLTEYARDTIQKLCKPFEKSVVIPHGIGDEFRQDAPANPWPSEGDRPIRALYVSNAAPYKHQWHVVAAIAKVRDAGHDVTLQLVGGGEGPAQERLERAMREHDPNGEFVEQTHFVKHSEVPSVLASADFFVFASSCENMPITLLEAMASALPIACSDRGPMPEVLQDVGAYFDPEDPDSIAAAIKRIIEDPSAREEMRSRSRAIADQYTWSRCSNETLDFLYECAMEARQQ